MINVLQTIVLSALFNVQIPINADMVMVAILQLVSADVVDVDPWIEYLHEFRETEPFFLRYDSEGRAYSKFEDAGYDSANFIQLLGPVYFFFLFYIGIGVLKFLLSIVFRCCKHRKIFGFVFAR